MSPYLSRLLSAVFVLVGCHFAATTTFGQSYQVDAGTSRVYVKVGTATALGHVHGIEGNLSSGKILFGGAGELVFDLTSFTADTPQARQYVGLPVQFSQSDAQKVTANMRGSDVLNVGRFPTTTFSIVAATPAEGQKPGDPGLYQLDGRFTLHGTTRPLSFTATVEQGSTPGTLHARGSFTILQTAYGIQPYSALAGLVKVADQLEVWGDLTLVPSK
jgi:polyisoprenoid-binding protein YceI